jgi:hypothetical protein
MIASLLYGVMQFPFLLRNEEKRYITRVVDTRFVLSFQGLWTIKQQCQETRFRDL